MPKPKRSTIGADPFASVIPQRTQTQPEPRPESPRKKHMTFLLRAEATERVKNAVFWTPGLTLADLADQALAEAVDRLEKKRGEPYPHRTSELKGGFPIR